MTTQHAEAGERITEEWLTKNGFKQEPGQRKYLLLIKGQLCCVAALFKGDDDFPGVYACRRDTGEGILVGPMSDTARLIKLIEALTGKEWPCK
ncbi:MAG TPA: hypothetical protein VHN11_00340 [Xanthobacteraceae bacterium]|jgi:hypothetical protein|nr:hypothetical protein [Xanthobacteraceae bacterium]